MLGIELVYQNFASLCKSAAKVQVIFETTKYFVLFLRKRLIL
jgi:hypothetical protein